MECSSLWVIETLMFIHLSNFSKFVSKSDRHGSESSVQSEMILQVNRSIAVAVQVYSRYYNYEICSAYTLDHAPNYRRFVFSADRLSYLIVMRLTQG